MPGIIFYDSITIYYYRYYYEGSPRARHGQRHTDTRVKEAPPVTCRTKGPRQSRLFGVPPRAREHVCACVCSTHVGARRGRTHVKCPSCLRGLRWRRRRRRRCCRRRRLTIGDSPGSAAASFPRRRVHHHQHRTPLRAYKSPSGALSYHPLRNHPHQHHGRRQPSHRRNLSRTPLVWRRRREVRAPVAYIIVNFYQPPPAGRPHRRSPSRRRHAPAQEEFRADGVAHARPQYRVERRRR